MKRLSGMLRRSQQRLYRTTSAFTLVETIVSMGVFGLVGLGMISLQLFGARQDALVQAKLGASDQSRMALAKMTDEIRSAKIFQIGKVVSSTFTPIANGTSQQGNALKLQLTMDATQYILYYFDTNAYKLYRQHSGSPLPARKLIATGLTNIASSSMSFKAENYRGNTQTDLTHKGVIVVLLEFAEYQYPYTKVGPGQRFDYYKMEFRVTPHVPDGP